MRVYVDTASLAEITEWVTHPWVSGFTTNPTLMRGHTTSNAFAWAKEAVDAAQGKPISIDGPEQIWELGPNVWRKTTEAGYWAIRSHAPQLNHTAVCHVRQIAGHYAASEIISVFAGRILDTGRDPQPVIDAAKATGAQVLWASVREPYHIVMAEKAGCDIITVPPPILRKWLDWHGKPLEQVAEETIAQFEKDREGLW